MFRVELALGAQIGEELTTWDVLHEEEEVARVLSEPLQADLGNKKSNLNNNVKERRGSPLLDINLCIEVSG